MPRSPYALVLALALAGAAPLPAAPTVVSWVYRLQPRDGQPCAEALAEVAATPTQLAVIDHACGDPPRPWTRDEVRALQRAPGGKRRWVLAYMSIGEAEDYRWYWRSSYRPARRLLGIRRAGNPR